MKGIKVIGLLALAAAALTVFVSTASATTITSPAGTAFTGTFKAESDGPITFDNPIANFECSSTIEGNVESHGAAATAVGSISSLLFTGCTNGWHVTATAAGSIAWHWRWGTIITWTSSSMQIEATRSGLSCKYGTNNTDLGSVIGSKTTEALATWELEGTTIPVTGGSFLCGTQVTATGSYTITSPTYLDVDE